MTTYTCLCNQFIYTSTGYFVRIFLVVQMYCNFQYRYVSVTKLLVISADLKWHMLTAYKRVTTFILTQTDSKVGTGAIVTTKQQAELFLSIFGGIIFFAENKNCNKRCFIGRYYFRLSHVLSLHWLVVSSDVGLVKSWEHSCQADLHASVAPPSSVTHEGSRSCFQIPVDKENKL